MAKTKKMNIQQEIQHFSDLIGNDRNIPIIKESFEKRLKSVIYEITGIHPNLLRSKTRKREIVQARQLFHTFMRDNTNLALSEIGFLTGGHDHATVLYSRNTINNLLENNKEIQDYYNRISKLII